MKKITDEELKTIKDHRSKIAELMQQVGVLEANKHAALHEVAEVNKEINDFKDALESKYGSINIDVTDGSYEEIKTKEPELENV